MKTIKDQVRQGDVLLHPVDGIPEGARKRKTARQFTAALGEATGHHHTVYAERAEDLEVYDFRGMTYLKVLTPDTLDHQEHGPVPLRERLYEVRRQQEDWQDQFRPVAD
jgi:hypothetical protein